MRVKGFSGAARARNESAWLLTPRGAIDHGLEANMRRFADDDEVDLVVVGAGAGGSVLTQRLARKGWRVVALDAGPFWDPEADWVSDEAGAGDLYWRENRVISGDNPVPMGSNNCGRGVGGSMVHYAGYAPRFHPSDFATLTNDGVGADWPIRYEELKPYYEHIEAELPVRGRRGRGVTRTPTRSHPTPSAGTDKWSRSAPARPGWRCGWVRSRSPTAASGTARTASTAGSASRDAR